MGSLRHNAEVHGIIVTAQPPVEGVAPANTPPATPEPKPQPLPRPFPLGPIVIDRIADHQDGLVVTLAQLADVRVNDNVLIAATGNVAVNGAWTAIAIDGPLVIVDNSYTLASPIVGKGRLTVPAC